MKTVLFANTDWYLYNFRLPLARALRASGHDVLLVSPRGEHAQRLVDAGFRWEAFDFSRRGVNPLAESLTLARLVALYRRERPRLAHHFTVKCVLYGGVAAQLVGTRAIVSSLTGLGHLFTTDSWRARFARPFAHQLYRRVLRRSEVIFQNPDDRDEFDRLGLVRAADTHLIRSSGVDVEHFVPPAAPAGDMFVLLVARLLREKGIGEFVAAARLLRARFPEARFAVAGDADPGNPTSIDAATLEAWRAAGDVEFLGYRDDILQLLQRSALVVLPSHREGVPRSLIEASACGLPIVATDVPGCREVVRDGENGLLVPAREPGRLAEAIGSLLGDASRRLAMGLRSREIAVREFAEERVIAATRSVYERALER